MLYLFIHGHNFQRSTLIRCLYNVDALKMCIKEFGSKTI